MSVIPSMAAFEKLLLYSHEKPRVVGSFGCRRVVERPGLGVGFVRWRGGGLSRFIATLGPAVNLRMSVPDSMTKRIALCPRSDQE